MFHDRQNVEVTYSLKEAVDLIHKIQTAYSPCLERGVILVCQSQDYGRGMLLGPHCLWFSNRAYL